MGGVDQKKKRRHKYEHYRHKICTDLYLRGKELCMSKIYIPTNVTSSCIHNFLPTVVIKTKEQNSVLPEKIWHLICPIMYLSFFNLGGWHFRLLSPVIHTTHEFYALHALS